MKAAATAIVAWTLSALAFVAPTCSAFEFSPHVYASRGASKRSPLAGRRATAKAGGAGRRIIVPEMMTTDEPGLRCVVPSRTGRRVSTTLMQAGNGDDGAKDGFFDGVEISPPFALAYVGFLLFAYVKTVGESPAGISNDIVLQFIQDPLNPGVNELFAVVFNLLGLVAIPMACLLMPGARDQKFPATPFLMASMFAGYGALGPYVMTRRAAPSVTESDLGWFTANVLENKVFNWAVTAMALSTLFVTGFAQAMASDPGSTLRGYADLFSSTAIVSASSVDLAILSLTMASLVPEDLKRRGVNDSGRARAIAASTLLLPVIGGTIYCALRPSLPEEQ